MLIHIHYLCHAVILSGAKNLALDFFADKQQGAILRGVYPDPAAAGERAQHDSERMLAKAPGPKSIAFNGLIAPVSQRRPEIADCHFRPCPLRTTGGGVFLYE
jgi:hypothetical protein